MLIIPTDLLSVSIQAKYMIQNQSFHKIAIQNSSRILATRKQSLLQASRLSQCTNFFTQHRQLKTMPSYFQLEIFSEVTPLPCYDQRIQVTATSSVFYCLSAVFWCELSINFEPTTTTCTLICVYYYYQYYCDLLVFATLYLL